MKLSKQWLFVGGLFFSLFFIDYLRLLLISPQDVLLIGMGIFALISSIFAIKKYYNKNLYFALTFLILVTMLVLYIEIMIKKTDLLSYSLLGLVFTLIIIWSAYDLSHKSMKYKNLIEEYDKDLKTNPKDTKAWNNKGTALVDIQMYDEAMKCFNKVLEIDPLDAAAWHNKGFNLEKLGKHRKAIKYYDKALQLDPKFEIAKKNGRIILEN